MSIWMIAALLLPYLVYVYVDYKHGQKKGILVAIFIVLGLGIFEYSNSGRIDTLFIVDAGFIVGLGLLSIRLKDSRYFKMQPTIIDLIFAAYIFYLQIWDTPLMVRYLPTFENYLNDPAMVEAMRAPSVAEFMGHLSLDLGFALVLHAALNAYAAVKLSNLKWVLVKVSILPIVMLTGVLANVLHGNPFQR